MAKQNVGAIDQQRRAEQSGAVELLGDACGDSNVVLQGQALQMLRVGPGHREAGIPFIQPGISWKNARVSRSGWTVTTPYLVWRLLETQSLVHQTPALCHKCERERERKKKKKEKKEEKKKERRKERRKERKKERKKEKKEEKQQREGGPERHASHSPTLNDGVFYATKIAESISW